MNKQRKVPVELLVIFLFITGISAIIWNTNPFGSSPPRPTASESKSPPADSHQTETNSDPQWQRGKTLFKANCASCHNPTVAQTGPALNGVTKRWEDAGTYQKKTGTQWLHVWIHDWNEAVASGYPYAVNIQHYTESSMNTFTNLTDAEIDDILHYAEMPNVVSARAVMP